MRSMLPVNSILYGINISISAVRGKRLILYTYESQDVYNEVSDKTQLR